MRRGDVVFVLWSLAVRKSMNSHTSLLIAGYNEFLRVLDYFKEFVEVVAAEACTVPLSLENL